MTDCNQISPGTGHPRPFLLSIRMPVGIFSSSATARYLLSGKKWRKRGQVPHTVGVLVTLDNSLGWNNLVYTDNLLFQRIRLLVCWIQVNFLDVVFLETASTYDNIVNVQRKWVKTERRMIWMLAGHRPKGAAMEQSCPALAALPRSKPPS